MTVTITLIMIIKNESKIIERCFDSVRGFVDYFVITDTGSTDNTVEIVENYLTKNNIRGKVYHDVWKNFGYNRTNSYRNGQDWCRNNNIDMENNYFVTIDADMILKIKPSFNKESLKDADYWLIQQMNNVITYYNSRLFKSSIPFVCNGVTHEYWGADNVQASCGKHQDIYIDDKGDGGCKQDKFERDIALLTKGIEDEPNNYRYYFYLAQSYDDSGKLDEAIKWYRKRIEAGNWEEEIYISYERIGNIYMKTGNPEKALFEWLNAYQALPSRSESLCAVINLYRNIGKNNLAMMYLEKALKIPYPSHLLLFINRHVYNYLLMEELSIVSYYTPTPILGFFACQYIQLSKEEIPQHKKENTYSNMFFYLNPYPWAFHKILQVPVDPIYKSSSSSLILSGNKHLRGIVRAVNYSITDDFQYIIRDENNFVKTKNYWAEFDRNYNLIHSYEIEYSQQPVRSSHIKGLEDVRICLLGESLYGLAVDFEYGRNNHPSISLLTFGKTKNKYFIDKITPITYNDHICQKNWVLYSENNKLFAVYSHHPLTILEINVKNGESTVIKEEFSEYDLSKLRGSSVPVKLPDGSWLFAVHEVIQKNTRKYFHRFLRYSKDWKLLDISLPFYIKTLFVEFTLSLCYDKDTNMVILPFSTRDNTTEVVSINLKDIPWIPKDIRKHINNLIAASGK